MQLSTYMSLDAVDLASLIKNKEVLPEELLSLAYQRLEKTNPELNAVIRTREEKVRKEAGQVSPNQLLAGVPMLLKDISQAIQGEALTAGSALLKHNKARQDSNFVHKLRQAGALLLGHTNAPELGLKNITEPELYGKTKNPWNLNHAAGGSSGGSAAAVAAGIVPVAGASDGGGSIRIPASFTSLFGLKPTRGRTPVGPGAGRQWQGAAIDFVISRTVRDSAYLLDILQTVQPEAAFQTPLYKGSYYRDVTGGMKQKFKVAFSVESPVGTPVSQEAVKAVRKVVKWLEQHGHKVEEQSNQVDGIRLMDSYYLMNSGEIAGVILTIEKALGRAVTFHDMEIVSWVLYQAGKNVSAAEFSLSLAQWDVAAARMAEFHQQYDLYITPATAFPAPQNGELTHDEAEIEELLKVDQLDGQEQQRLIYDMFKSSLTYTPFTQLANLTGQPAVSIPVHLTAERLPLGVQVVAPKGREDWLLQLSAQLEQSDLWIGMDGNPFFG